MQQSIGLKQFVVTHLGGTALAFGIVLSTALGVTALSATGNLPWTHSSAAPAAAQRSLAQAQQTQFFDAKLARQEALELHASTVAAQAAVHAKLLRFYAHKEELLLSIASDHGLLVMNGLDRGNAITHLQLRGTSAP